MNSLCLVLRLHEFILSNKRKSMFLVRTIEKEINDRKSNLTREWHVKREDAKY